MTNKAAVFSQAILPYLPKIKQLALKLSGNQADAEDLIQDAMIKIYPVFFDLDKSKNINAWIGRVVYNTYVDNWRKQQNKKTPQTVNAVEIIDLQNFENDASTRLCPSLLLEMDDEQKEATRLIYQLKNEQRILLILHDIEGYSLNELSLTLNAPTGTIKSRLHRARKKLRELMFGEEQQPSENVA